MASLQLAAGGFPNFSSSHSISTAVRVVGFSSSTSLAVEFSLAAEVFTEARGDEGFVETSMLPGFCGVFKASDIAIV